jgi:hypothetical protein
MPEYRVFEGSLQERFIASRNKVQFYGGGFANGKTSCACIKTLQIAKEYPGANILVARSTYPKLNDTIRKELFKWLPEFWIKGFSKTDNVLILKNGTTINFRYIAQQGKGTAGQTSSNLLSATYDLVVVDQIEDPEIAEKDFDDLLGRLRGMARYIGDDPTMPKTGPRWIMITSNPTRNWVYRKLVKPLLHYQTTGMKHPDLLVDINTKEPLVDLIEGSTYENKDNLEPDFINTLESTYHGQQRDRFLMGEWAAYEGLVYPEYDDSIHVLPKDRILNYFMDLIGNRMRPTIIQGFDYGIAVPSCYLVGFVDDRGNIFIVDGYYAHELTLIEITDRIKVIRKKWLYSSTCDDMVYADPAIFRRTTGGHKTVGKTLATLAMEEGVRMVRGNNDISNGITKLKGYLAPIKFHLNPVLLTNPAPHLYFSDHLEFIMSEISEYYWKKDTQGDVSDKPTDKNDHAMDTLKYMLSHVPSVAAVSGYSQVQKPSYMRWAEVEDKPRNTRAHRSQ